MVKVLHYTELLFGLRGVPLLSDLVGLALRTVVKVLHCTEAGWVDRLLRPVVKVLHWLGNLGVSLFSGESVTLNGFALWATRRPFVV